MHDFELPTNSWGVLPNNMASVASRTELGTFYLPKLEIGIGYFLLGIASNQIHANCSIYEI